MPEEALKLAEAFWPGPLTMILDKSEKVPYETTGGLDTVAIRFPVHPVARLLIGLSGTYIAAPSANISGRPSPTSAAHVIEDLDGRIDMIIDGGDVEIGLESTIVDLTSEVPTVLRPGYIGLPDIQRVIGEARLDPGLDGSHENVRPKAPGMKYKHYSPRGEVYIVEGSKEDVIARINKETDRCAASGIKAAVVASDEYEIGYTCSKIYHIGSRDNEEQAAHRLYAILRKADADAIEEIYAESYEGGRLSGAIMNRLVKAAGHKVIKA